MSLKPPSICLTVRQCSDLKDRIALRLFRDMMKDTARLHHSDCAEDAYKWAEAFLTARQNLDTHVEGWESVSENSWED
jgi:hypothetical protein